MSDEAEGSPTRGDLVGGENSESGLAPLNPLTLPLLLLFGGIILGLGALIYLGTHDYTTGCFSPDAYDGIYVDCPDQSRIPTIAVACAGGVIAAIGLLATVLRAALRPSTSEGSSTLRGSAAVTNVTDELTRAAALHKSGALTDSEYQTLKRKLLGEDQ